MPKLHHADSKLVIEPDAEQAPMYEAQGWHEKPKPEK